MRARTVAERQREEEKQKRLDNIYKEKAKRAEKEMAGKVLWFFCWLFCLFLKQPFVRLRKTDSNRIAIQAIADHRVQE